MPRCAPLRGLRLLLAACLGSVVLAAPTAICPASMAVGEAHNCFVSDPDDAGVSALELYKESTGVVLASAAPRDAAPGMYFFALGADAELGEYRVRVRYGPTGDEQSIGAVVQVVGEAAMVLVELDKALYKPGQTVLVRALVLRIAQLTPLAGRTVQFTVVSPKGPSLLKVEGETDTHGVAQFTWPIAEEPLLGQHLARATVIGGSGAAATHEVVFGVEEYVLPRFEVHVTVDQAYLVEPPWDNQVGTVDVSGHVAANYTFGEGVRGEVLVSVLGAVGYSGGFGGGIAGGIAAAAVRMAAPDGMAKEASSGSGPSAGGYLTLAIQHGVALSPEAGANFRVAVPRASLRAGQPLLIEAAVVDAATGERQNGTATLPVVYEGAQLVPDVATTDGGEIFRPGLPLSLRVSMKRPDGEVAAADAISAKKFNLVVHRRHVNYTYDSAEDIRTKVAVENFADGVVDVSVWIPTDNSVCCNPLANAATYDEYQKTMGCCTASIEAWVEQDGARLWGDALCLSRAYSPSGVFLALEPPSETSPSPLLRSTVNPTELQNTLTYYVLRGGAVLVAGTASLPEGTTTAAGYWEGSLPIDIPESATGTCRLVVVARTAADGVAATAAAGFTRELEWAFTLSASFSQQEVLPGAALSVDFSATGLASDNAAYVFAVSLDRSAELLGPRASIGAGAVLAALQRAADGSAALAPAPKVWRECGAHGVEAAVVAELGPSLAVLADGTSKAPPEDADMPYGTSLGPNCPRPIEQSCSGGGMDGDVKIMAGVVDMAPAMAERADADSNANSDTASKSVSAGDARGVAVRRFFPETWLWIDQALSGSGTPTASRSVTAPDTITTWSLEAFATTPQGLAVVRAEKPLRVFKPFFVEVRLPYSAIRREIVEVAFAVFNYAEGSGTVLADVSVALPPGMLLAEGDAALQLSIAEGSSASARFGINATALGVQRFQISATVVGNADLSDTIERALLVEPEGYEVRKTENVVIELSEGGGEVQHILQQTVPADVVSDSVRGTVSAVGDILGPTISGLEGLLQIPTGCGEQNMITLAPNVYVAKYLTAVGRLRPELRQKIIRNMIVGYGRELTYRHDDGSFSAFGTSDPHGSTWLTAFVLKTFAEIQASGLVAIDADVLAAAAQFLITMQAEDGSFREEGMVIHTEMTGGVSAESALTSYVASALANAADQVPAISNQLLEEALRRAKGFVEAAAATHVYTNLLRLWALYQAELIDAATAATGALALSQEAAEGQHRFWTSAGSAAQDVELTGYGVLLLTSTGRLAEAFQAVRWLLYRRSASGGFESTQDTVVALNALATYASSVSGSTDLTLSVVGAGGLSKAWTINGGNSDVLQSVNLPVPREALTVQASGSGVALVVSEVVYNTVTPPVEPCYNMDVQWYIDTPTQGGMVKACASRLASCAGAAGTGMAIVSVGLYTGYSASAPSLEALRSSGVVRRYEVADARVDLYVDAAPGQKEACLEFEVVREVPVQGLQARASKVFEYYAPDNSGQVLTAFTPQAMQQGVSSSAAMSWPASGLTVAVLLARFLGVLGPAP